MKRMFALFISIALVFSLSVPALAASSEMIDAANALHELGLFNGTGTDSAGNPIFDLDRSPTRYEAVTMLVRLLGKDTEAQDGTWTSPFTDVVDWARPYVGYAYTNGLTSGTSATTYGGSSQVTVTQYLTFVLRALGYQSGTDFQWDKAWELSDKIGLTDGCYNASTTNFTRGDVVIISYSALSVNLKDSDQTLWDSLGSSRPIESPQPMEPSHPAASNESVTKLVNHIATYGKANTAGGKFIEFNLENAMSAISYDCVENQLTFIFTYKLSGLKVTVAFKYDVATGQALSPLDIFCSDAATDYLYFGARADFNMTTYTKNTALTISDFASELPASTYESGKKTCASAIKSAFATWNLHLLTTLNMELSDIGFTSYTT